MRVLLTVALLSVTVLAGCLSSDSTDNTPVAATDYTAPSVPTVDAQETVDLSAEMLHLFAMQPTVDLDAVIA